MNKSTSIAACLPLVAGVCAAADAPPQAEISNGLVRARLYLPDATHGYYRGTRFDWSGVIGSLEFAGHEYYPQWFQRTDPKVHDFVYEGPDIVAGPCTAVTGPVEEFTANGKALGYDDARPGGTFIKIGVGALRKPDDRPYDPYRLYEIANGGTWTVQKSPTSIEFRQVLADPATGYGYEYRKTVSLTPGAPQLVLSHALRNTGTRAIQTSVYNHNFLYLDKQAPGPDTSITLPFPLRRSGPAKASLAEIQDNRIRFTKTLSEEESVYLPLTGFGREAKDYDIQIEYRNAGAGVRITADRPLSRVALWAIRAPLSFEPFIDLDVAPGAEFTWRIQYDHYVTSGANR